MSTTPLPTQRSLPRSTPIFARPPNTPLPGAVPTTVTPRVGGVLPDGGSGEAWTGGSNIVHCHMPTHLGQRRPMKYGSSSALLEKIEAGSKDKLGTNDQKSDISFQMWMRTPSQGLVKLGLDTVFLIPN